MAPFLAVGLHFAIRPRAAKAAEDLSMPVEVLVGLAAGLATFVASVMADDQRERLRNGTFGTVAGTFIGGLGTLLTQNQSLVLIGFFGSAVGAAAGWVAYLILAYVASDPTGRRLVEYQIRGLSGVTDQITQDQEALLVAALTKWFTNYGRLVSTQREQLTILRGAGDMNSIIGTVIESWIRTPTDTFNLVLDALVKLKPDYRSRATVILFGEKAGKVEGRHWKSYSGALPAHKNTPFDLRSIAYQVAFGTVRSPFFDLSDSGDKQGQQREHDSYNSFVVVRVNQQAVVSLDWPAALNTTDAYMQVLRGSFQQDIAPAMDALLDCWSGDVSKEVGLTTPAKWPPPEEPETSKRASR